MEKHPLCPSVHSAIRNDVVTLQGLPDISEPGKGQAQPRRDIQEKHKGHSSEDSGWSSHVLSASRDLKGHSENSVAVCS